MSNIKISRYATPTTEQRAAVAADMTARGIEQPESPFPADTYGGIIEPADRSWIIFLDTDGKPSHYYPVRDIATGARTAEVLALDWESLRLDKSPYEVRIDKTVAKRLDGKLVVQTHTKNNLIRELELPESVAGMLLRRRVDATCDLIFPSQAGTPRWPDSMRRDWREALRGSPYEGLKPGLYRKAVATHIAERLGVEAARDQLGHTGLANLKYYVEQSKRGPQAAAVIDELFEQSAD